jgi:NADH-quinone oxidoreductase subunit C
MSTESDGGVPAAMPVGAEVGAPAQTPPSPERGMFGVQGSGDVSGFGGLVRRRPTEADSPRPYGSYFDEVHDSLEEAYPGFADAIEKVIVDRGELTLHIKPDRIAEVCQIMRDDDALRFELCSSVDAVDYLGSDPRRFHISYQLTSMTYRRRVRLEAAVAADQALPSVTGIYPTADWQEREVYDMFGVVRPSQPDPDPHAGRLGGLPATQGLPARRRAGGIQGRRDPAS